MTKLLVVDPDTAITTQIQTFFSKEGYEVFVAHTGQEGLKLVSEAKPDALILEINLLDRGGYIFIGELYETLQQSTPPYIFIEDENNRDYVIGDPILPEDYITKPFEIEELNLCVQKVLLRADRLKSFNPITDFMYWQPFEEQMREALQRPKWTYFDLKIAFFDAFSEIYTYAAADDALLFLSTLIQETVKQFGTTDDIAGHPQRNTLVLLTYANEPVKLVQYMIAQFDEGMKPHYFPADLERGYTIIDEQKVPLMTLAAGWVSWSDELKIDNLREIADLAVEDRRRRSGENTTPPNPIIW